MPAATCQVQNSAGLCQADVNDCRPCFYPLHCTAFIRRQPFLPSCTYIHSTELAPDIEEEEEVCA